MDLVNKYDDDSYYNGFDHDIHNPTTLMDEYIVYFDVSILVMISLGVVIICLCLGLFVGYMYQKIKVFCK